MAEERAKASIQGLPQPEFDKADFRSNLDRKVRSNMRKESIA